MHGRTQESHLPRTYLIILQGLITGLAAWILTGHGFLGLGSGSLPVEGSLARRAIVLAAATFYFLRMCFAIFVPVRRFIGWFDVATSVLWAGIVQLGFAAITVSTNRPLAKADLIAVALYLLGSYLSSGSEYALLRWKRRPENHERLYTKGLFQYSRHMDYFGETLLFLGYALLTGNVLALVIPAALAGFFLFINIPALDQYLQQRYGEEFAQYERTTKKFVPFLY